MTFNQRPLLPITHQSHGKIKWERVFFNCDFERPKVPLVHFRLPILSLWSLPKRELLNLLPQCCYSKTWVSTQTQKHRRTWNLTRQRNITAHKHTHVKKLNKIYPHNDHISLKSYSSICFAILFFLGHRLSQRSYMNYRNFYWSQIYKVTIAIISAEYVLLYC